MQIGAGDGSKDIVTTKKYYLFKKCATNFNDYSYSAYFSASPSNLLFLTYGYQSYDGSATPNFYYEFELIQYTKLTEPIDNVTRS